MQCGFLLDIVVWQGTPILKLFSCKDKTLLIRGDALLVLDLGLHIVNCVRWLDIKGNGLTSEGLDKNLHTSTKTENQMQCGFLLDIVVWQGTPILKLFSCKDKTLLIRGDALLVLDLGLHIVNCVRWLDIKGNGLTSEGLNENLKWMK